MTATPDRIVRVLEESHLVEALSAARSEQRTVRCVGGGHSFNALAATDDTLLDMRSLRGVEAIDEQGLAASFRAGTTIAEINETLAARGLALDNLGSLATQTIAGAIATGNHGTGSEFGPLSTLVTTIRMITPDGGVRNLSRDRDTHLFRAASTSLGVLGVVVSLTLRVRPAFAVLIETERIPVERALHEAEALLRSARHVALSWSPWLDHMTVTRMNESEEKPARWARGYPLLTTAEEVRAGLVSAASAVWPRCASSLVTAVPLPPRPQRMVVASPDAFSFAQPVRFIALEHALPIEATVEALRTVRAILHRSDQCSPYPVLLRVGAADNGYLSPASGRPTAYLNVTIPRGAAYTHLHRDIETSLRSLGGRPHWGKAHTATACELRALYPEWESFVQVRRSLDPGLTMTSPYLDSLLRA